MQRQLFVKKEAVGEFGKAPAERTPAELIQYGIVNFDKPKGPSSHQVSDYVQKILKISKAGHSGTLDPQVTGVQPVALGRATRITQFLLTAPKEYVGIMHLHHEVPEELFSKTITQFTGKIKQLPPVKSAVKRVERERGAGKGQRAESAAGDHSGARDVFGHGGGIISDRPSGGV